MVVLLAKTHLFGCRVEAILLPDIVVRPFAINATPRGSKYRTFKDSGPQSHEGVVSGTRVLKYWVLAPSGRPIPAAVERITARKRWFRKNGRRTHPCFFAALQRF